MAKRDLERLEREIDKFDKKINALNTQLRDCLNALEATREAFLEAVRGKDELILELMKKLELKI